MTMNTFIAAKFIVEVLQRWTWQLKQFVEWKEQLTKYLALDKAKDSSESNDEVSAEKAKLEKDKKAENMSFSESSEADEVPAKKMRLEKDMKAEIDFAEATHKLMRQILEVQEMLQRKLRQINTERESFAEYLSYSFRSVPQDKRLHCFIDCMEIILKNRVTEE